MDIWFRESREPLPRGTRATLQPCYIDRRRLSEHVGGATPSAPLTLLIMDDPYSWVLAQHRREPVWQDGADFPEEHSSPVLGRVARPHPARHRGDQCRPSRSPVEEIRRPK